MFFLYFMFVSISIVILQSYIFLQLVAVNLTFLHNNNLLCVFKRRALHSDHVSYSWMKFWLCFNLLSRQVFGVQGCIYLKFTDKLFPLS